MNMFFMTRRKREGNRPEITSTLTTVLLKRSMEGKVESRVDWRTETGFSDLHHLEV